MVDAAAYGDKRSGEFGDVSFDVDEHNWQCKGR